MMLQGPLYEWKIWLSTLLVVVASVGYAEDQGHRVFRVGFVYAQSPSTAPAGVGAFRDRLPELGDVQGQNLVIESRWAGNRSHRLPELVNEVIARNVDVLLVAATPADIAAMNATSRLPTESLAV